MKYIEIWLADLFKAACIKDILNVNWLPVIIQAKQITILVKKIIKNSTKLQIKLTTLKVKLRLEIKKCKSTEFSINKKSTSLVPLGSLETTKFCPQKILSFQLGDPKFCACIYQKYFDQILTVQIVLWLPCFRTFGEPFPVDQELSIFAAPFHVDNILDFIFFLFAV